MSQDDQRAREFLHNKYPDTTAEELQDETFICGDVVDFMVEFAEAAHQRGYEAGLEAAAQLCDQRWIGNGVLSVAAEIRALPRKG